MREAESAAHFKRACDAGKIVLLDERRRHWQVAADWAKSNGRSMPKEKPKKAPKKGKAQTEAEDAEDAPQDEAEKKPTLEYLPVTAKVPTKKQKNKIKTEKQ